MGISSDATRGMPGGGEGVKRPGVAPGDVRPSVDCLLPRPARVPRRFSGPPADDDDEDDDESSVFFSRSMASRSALSSVLLGRGATGAMDTRMLWLGDCASFLPGAERARGQLCQRLQ